MYTLRPYQQEALDKLRHQIRGGAKRIILVSPTGSGKTVMASELIRSAADKGSHVLVLAHRRELIHQCSDKLSENEVHHGIIMAGEGRAALAEVQVASKDTLVSRAIRRQVIDLPRADLLVLDECHRSVAPTWKQLIEQYPDAVIVGLTATPARKDGKGLADIYQSMVVAASYEDLIKQGSLVPTRVFAPYRPDLKGVKVTAGDYNEKQLQKRMDKTKLVGDIYNNWKKIAGDRPTIIFASGIKHSYHIHDRFKSNGVRIEHIDGDMDNRQRDQLLRMFHRGDIQVITNVGVLTEGYDCPRCSCIVLARPTRSMVLYRQMAGRCQRPHDGKDDAIVLDHAGAVFMHGAPDDDIPWVLTETKKVIERKDAEAREKPLIVCENCGFAYRGVPACPECGAAAPARKPKPIKTVAGELSEVKRRRAYKESTPKQRDDYWVRCLHVAAHRHSKVGAAAHMFKDRFGVFPRAVDGVKDLPKGKIEWNLRAQEWLDRLANKLAAERSPTMTSSDWRLFG